MKISIITVSYNSEKTIEKTINSVLEQTHKDIEYLIIDGKSTDNTMKIVNSHADKISYFISESDDGIYSAINKGIKKASGDIISILHSNDIFYEKDTLEKVHKSFKDEKIDFLLSSVCFKKNFDKNKINRIYNSNYFKPWMLKFGFSPAHPGFFALKSNYINLGLYNEKMKIASDFDFFVRLFASKNISYSYINIITVIMSLGGLSTKGYKSYLLSTKEIYSSLKKNNIKSNYFFVCIRFLIKIFQFKI
tara:strand:+ start:5394 stop:6140 length:747 start_codon:yes stop_codon:yes gene_type:complete